MKTKTAKSLGKKTLCLMLSVIMVLCMIPTVAFADGNAPTLNSISFGNSAAIISGTWSDSDFDSDVLTYNLRRAEGYSSVKMYIGYDDTKYNATVSYRKNYYGTVSDANEAWDNDPDWGNYLYLMAEDTVVTITVADNNDAANKTVYTLNIGYGEEQNEIPQYEEDNALYSYAPITVKNTVNYSACDIYQADANGNATASKEVTNDHKYYAAELNEGFNDFYFTASPNGANAKVRYSINGGEWQTWGAWSSPKIETPAVVDFQIISENDYMTGTEGWDGKTTNDFSVWVTTAGMFEGEGTEAEPYLIKTEADLEMLNECAEAGFAFAGKFFKLANDITMTDATWDGIGESLVEMGESWGTAVPVTKEFKPFSGNFNGDGHTITFAKGSKALFDCVRGAKIENLKIKGEYINDNGLISTYTQDGSNHTADIANVTILSGTKIAGSGFLGGYASSANTVNIENCHIEKDVIIGCDENGKSLDKDKIGGFAGEFNGTIKNSTSAATVYGKNYVGGIVAAKGQSLSTFDITNCTFSGKLVATGNFVGGIAGGGYAGSYWGLAANAGFVSITDCKVTGDIEAADCVGGIFGGDEGVVQCWDNGKGAVKDNAFTGTIKSEGKYVGGVIGFLKSLNKVQDISGNTFKGTDTLTKGIGGIEFVDTSAATTAGGANYVNTAGLSVSELNAINDKYNLKDNWGYAGFSKKDHNRNDDPLGVDADKLAKNTYVKEDGNGTGGVTGGTTDGDNTNNGAAGGNSAGTTTAPTTPKTGDTADLGLWLALAVTGSMGVALAIKNNKNNKAA